MGLSRWGPPPERGVAAAKGGAAAGERVLVTERSRRQRGGAAAGERGRHMEERSTDLVALVAGWMWRRSRRARRGLWCGRMGERAGSHEGERTRGAGEGERAGSHAGDAGLREAARGGAGAARALRVRAEEELPELRLAIGQLLRGLQVAAVLIRLLGTRHVHRARGQKQQEANYQSRHELTSRLRERRCWRRS